MRTGIADTLEWLEADGLGGFASGTVTGRRTRRYHALLLSAVTPPTGRMVLVNGLEVRVETAAGVFDLSAQHYVPDVLHPRGDQRMESFTDDPWPTWIYRLPDGVRVTYELFVPRGYSGTVLRWKISDPAPGTRLIVRPLMSGRDYHSLHHENAAFRFEPQVSHAEPGQTMIAAWSPYNGVPAIRMVSNGEYHHQPCWYRRFLYQEERSRGLDCEEDLASPGEFTFDPACGSAVLVLTDDGRYAISPETSESAVRLAERLALAEQTRRSAFSSRLRRAAADYLVHRGSGQTIVAGYPWFTDWGRDTFIALRGLCLTTGQFDVAGRILLEWAGTVSGGMLPNRFPDHGSEPEFNSVDASLWFIIAAHEYLTHSDDHGHDVFPANRQAIEAAIQKILAGYVAGTRFGIRADADGLLSAGQSGVQLTWMDAKYGDHVVTPRIGKPVEVQALWINALWVGSRISSEWTALFTEARDAFVRRFWNERTGCLYDVIDVDHQPGQVDASIRPNQVFAVGGLPLCLLPPDKARQVIDCIESHLLTPLGLRTLAPANPAYQSHYAGGVAQRDGAYHQGTVWPWLMASFVDAWLRVFGEDDAGRDEARRRFVMPLIEHLDSAGLGHVSEIADAEVPHDPRGCPFQAWSVGELLRLQSMVNGPGPSRLARKSAAPAASQPSARKRGLSKTTT